MKIEMPEDRLVEPKSCSRLDPFLRWAGGKRWLMARFPNLIHIREGSTYFEPFVGSGAVFAQLSPRRAVISDLNPELIATYRAVKASPELVGSLLGEHDRLHSKLHYYSVRADVSAEDDASIASRFIYLNRTCFNGIYRVNRQGLFNVPMGTRRSICRDDDDFHAWSRALSNADLLDGDFESIIARAREGDLVYADPPYTVKHNLNAFRKYNESLFSWDDQLRLADSLTKAAKRGVRVVVTNANHASISDIYPTSFLRKSIARKSAIAASAEKRGVYDELLLWTEGTVDERVLS